ncbi:hypothetical protein ACJJTC_001260 [Scirpophaga incertulas]
MYSTWKNADLKNELKRRGASQQGKKADLVARLEAYDKNFNFNNILSGHNSPESQMELPNETLFRDVNSNTLLPPLTKQHIHLYFSRFNKKTDDGFNMYESRYLLVLRSCVIGHDTFIKGICKASMKKLQYEVNIKLTKTGNIIGECTCECAVGSGKEAHCKHVAVVMFGVEQMHREKCIILHVACTQKLQTFHMPKKMFTASPLKAEKLPSKRRLSNIIFHPYDVNTISVEEYNTKIRNICVAATTSTMPLKQRYGPANPFAIINDHIYIEDPREKLLDSLLLSKVTKEKILEIERMTRGQSYNKMWHEKRQDRITASKFHTVCHLSAQRQKSFAEQMLLPKSFSSRATNHGIINEPIAIKLYMEEFGIEVKNCGLFLSYKYPFLGASPDGLVGEETIIEVKCPYASRNQLINECTVPYLCKINGELSLKQTCIYYYQIQGQLFVTEKKFCNLIIYTFKDIKVIFINRNEEFINNMVQVLVNFYNNYYKEAILNKYIYKNYE